MSWLWWFLSGALVFLQGIAYLGYTKGVTFCNENYGWGLLGSTRFLVALEWTLLCTVMLWLWNDAIKTAMQKIGLLVVFIGGFSNALERFFYGCVNDYLIIPFVGSYINIADIFIVVGCSLLLWEFRKNIYSSQM